MERKLETIDISKISKQLSAILEVHNTNYVIKKFTRNYTLHRDFEKAKTIVNTYLNDLELNIPLNSIDINSLVVILEGVLSTSNKFNNVIAEFIKNDFGVYTKITIEEFPNTKIYSVGSIGNYYGGLRIKEQNNKYFWSIEDYSGDRWEVITKELFNSLLLHKCERLNNKEWFLEND